MTEQEMRDIVERARMRDEHREALLRQALAGDPSARFVIFALRRRQHKTMGESTNRREP